MWDGVLYLYLHNTLSIIWAQTFFQKIKENTPLTWKADFLLMVANPHSLRSLVWYQLLSPYFPIPPRPLPPFWPILCYNDDINNFGLLVQNTTLYQSLLQWYLTRNNMILWQGYNCFTEILTQSVYTFSSSYIYSQILLRHLCLWDMLLWDILLWDLHLCDILLYSS